MSADGAEVAQNFVAGDRGDADLLDFQAAGDVGQANGVGVTRARGERQPEHAQHHVAGAGDVVHLPRSRRVDAAGAVAAGQGHAVLVERDDAGFEVESGAQFRRGRESI